MGDGQEYTKQTPVVIGHYQLTETIRTSGRLTNQTVDIGELPIMIFQQPRYASDSTANPA